MNAIKWYKCDLCDYKTKRNFDLKRHHNAKHLSNHLNSIEKIKICQNVPSEEQNVPSSNYCKKCNKSYKTNRHFVNHEIKCKGIDELTCSKCMVSFSTRQHKYNHIKRNNCNAKSILYARNINNQIDNISNTSGVCTIQNIQHVETLNNFVNNKIIINNFGSERIDHISDEEIQHILQSGINTVPMYIEKKHFDKNFPENKNIKYTNDNKCQVMEDNTWIEKDLGLLSTNLIKDNSEVLLMYCDDNEITLSNTIHDTDKFDHIRNKLFIIYNKSDHRKYNEILTKIKELIKNS